MNRTAVGSSRSAKALASRLAVLLCAGALAACDAAPTEPASAPNTIRPSLSPGHYRREEISGVATSTCSGEDVALSGTTLFFFDQSTDATGGVHVTASLDQHLAGVGLVSGSKYVAEANSKLSLYLPAGSTPWVNGGFHVTEPLHIEFIGQGGVPNQILDAMWHVTFNNNGELTSFINSYSMRCK